jgi:hypothetical protein
VANRETDSRRLGAVLILNIKPATSRDSQCKVMRTAQQLDDEDRKVFLDAIADSETWSAYALDIELRKRGILCSNDTILYHRRGVCKCHV